MKDKYILLDDIQNLGKAGDIVTVSNGYARNFLIPGKLAVKASKGALRQVEAHKEKIEAKRKAEIAELQTIADKIKELEINITMNVGEDEKLYGSVTSHTISEEINKLGVDIDHQKVILESPIKELGSYDVKIKLHPEVIAIAKVWVVRA
ncbi:MAG TPA: 50S ribosomal protein L9 [Victivallales bacterium]|nr:50S ribosomal protein L9 [Victivallales bacterium]